MRALALAVLLCAATQSAWAQSKRYPPVAPDKDLEQERHSQLWSDALHPDQGPYMELVRDAKRLIDHGGADDIKAALEKLDTAIKRVPKQSDAYAVRGYLFLTQREWAKCADDLVLADQTSTTDDPTSRTHRLIDLGVCQARAGRHADAERTLVRAAANAQAYKGELMMRLGETRIALGKLDEAIDALEAALEANDSLNDMSRWLLAVAYDRARRPTDAQQYALDAKRYDQALTLISSPRMPLLGAGDTEYLYGVAYLYALPRPEYALLYFRRFLAVAPDSPWKRRAEEHVRELSALKLPSRDTITTSGSAAVNVDQLRTALEKPMPQLRACVAKLPNAAFQLTITKVGPRTPETARDRPIYRVPPPDVRAANVLNVDNNVTQAEVATSITCLEKLANTLSLPPPKERDSFYRVTFIIVAP